MLEELLSILPVEAVAQRLGVTARSIHYWRHRGVPARRAGQIAALADELRTELQPVFEATLNSAVTELESWVLEHRFAIAQDVWNCLERQGVQMLDPVARAEALDRLARTAFLTEGSA